MSFAKFMTLVRMVEGGASNNPDDPGGETVCGITRATWEAAGYRNFPPSNWEIDDFYLKQFWKPYRCEELPEPADSVFGQLVINLPSNRRIEALQAAVGAYPDGDWGAETSLAIKVVGDGKTLAMRILVAQGMHYLDIHSPSDWDEKGLIGRIAKVRKAISNGMLGG